MAGFNLVGHLHASAGLGITARSFARVLEKHGHDVVGLDISYGADPQRKTEAVDFDVVASAEALPYSHTLWFTAIQLLPSLWLRRLRRLQDSRFRNAGFLFWELPVLPKPWVPAVQLFDALVVSSAFVKQTLETYVENKPVIFAEHPLLLPPALPPAHQVRAGLGIPDDAFVFCASFDLAGDVARKNPAAIVDVFRHAFPADDGVQLVLKCNGDLAAAGEHPAIRAVLAHAARDPRIRLVTASMRYEEVLALYNAADAYLSFHRAEGLGLGPMEAMALGKPVIATGFSGNTEYMTEQNSILVPYRLVQTMGSRWQYTSRFAGKSAKWADIDFHQAVEAVRRIRDDAVLRGTISRRAHRDIQERQETAWEAAYIPRLIEALDAGGADLDRSLLTRKLRRAEFFNPLLMELNAKASFRRFSRHVYNKTPHWG